MWCIMLWIHFLMQCLFVYDTRLLAIFQNYWKILRNEILLKRRSNHVEKLTFAREEKKLCGLKPTVF